MKKKTSTVLIISYDDDKIKSFNINSHFIKYYKRYFFGFLSFFALFTAALFAFIFSSNNVRVENSSLNNEITQINKKVELIDSLKLKEKLNVIDGNLSVIHSYLISRGIFNKGIDVNGEISNQYSRYYKVKELAEQSEVFLKSVMSVPLGLPFYGKISSEYGYRKNPFGGYVGEFHPGIDIKGSVGDEVYATADGIVVRNDWYGGYGNAVLIDHGSGLTTLYGHLSRVNVVPGQEVKTGDVIGFMGSTGRSTGPHVHYEIRKNGEDIDPAPYLTLNY